MIALMLVLGPVLAFILLVALVVVLLVWEIVVPLTAVCLGLWLTVEVSLRAGEKLGRWILRFAKRL